MKENRIRILVDVKDQRPCRFYLSSPAPDQSRTPDIEPKHWFLKKLESAYETARRAIEDADSGLLRRLKQIIYHLESKIGPEEMMMKQLRKADVVEVVYPPPVQEKRVRRLFRRFIRQRLHYHQRWLLINVLLLPLTGLMMLLPGPNIFFGWNAFRLISHYLASEGGQRVRGGLCAVRFIPDQSLISATDNQKC